MILLEEWKQIQIDDVEYDYSVSSHGRVRNVKTGRILKTRKTPQGYLIVTLRKNKKPKQITVHRLVATMFIPNPDNLPEINHISEDKEDCRVENLEWCTREYNIHYGTGIERSAEKRRKHPKREKCEPRFKRVKCIETGVIYESTVDVENKTGLRRASVWKCCTGKRQTCGKCHWEYVD